MRPATLLIMTQPVTSKEHFSQPASQNAILQKAIAGRHDLLKSIPSVPAILQSLIGEVSQAPEKVDLDRVSDLISRDKSLAAQCLRLANSPLYGRSARTETVRGAVRALGIGHIRDIAVSTMMMQLGGAQKGMNPVVFWEHSLGCAIVARKLARAVGFDDPEKVYLAGLLHDLGYIVNMVLFPQEEKAALESALASGEFLGLSEYETLGFTHCQSGEVLARFWNFSDDLIEVILCHHNAEAAVNNPALVAIVALADRLCRSHALGVGYVESSDPALSWQLDWNILRQKTPYATKMEWRDFVKDADAYLAEVKDLVQALCHS
ncbi:MAG TPA: HDOD domain-containing protein [Candidatus Dormibacteraeota bacterium]|nr:HDOD domain-containing protein [Candidatus Dormibacteraeota bacterium]